MEQEEDGMGLVLVLDIVAAAVVAVAVAVVCQQGCCCLTGLGSSLTTRPTLGAAVT
eukprot:COSAG06_NODE_757_length_12510_cov_69.462529_3_plen_56_part_00